MPYLKEQAKRVLEKERQHHFRKARIAVSGSNVSIFLQLLHCWVYVP
jgi:hypothetical protein